MNITGIAARTQLVTLTTGSFRPTRRHRAETAAENARHNTNAARVSVRLSDHPALRELTRIHHAAYRVHIGLTLPSVQDGMRMLPAGRQFEHATEMQTHLALHDAQVALYKADYPTEVATSAQRLGTLHDPSMWPSNIDDCFVFEFRYLPCPTDGSWADWLQESARAAEDEVRERVTDTLQRVIDRCRAEGPLYATVFSDVSELAAILPDLNITAAPDIDAIVREAKSLAATSLDDVRTDPAARANAAAEAERILSILD